MAGKPRSSRKTRVAGRTEEVSHAAPRRDPRRAILDAAEAVIAEKSLPRASVEDIAKKAKVSTDVLHAYFSGKPAILRALGDRFCEQVIELSRQASRTGIWANTSPRDFVELCVRSIVDIVFEREALVRALLAHGTLDPAISAALVRIGADVTARAHGVLPECQGSPKIDKRKLGYALSMAAAVAHQSILLARDWSGEYISRGEVAHETVRAACAYLGLD
jgi:AcrR family transcriptional regulator